VVFAKRHPRLYLWVRPRSLLFHFLFVSISTGCLFAAWWQIHRAEAGNVLSYFYSVEWPAFVVVGGIGWWQLVHDTDEDIARRRAYHERVRRASAEVVARTLPRAAFALTVDSEEVASRSLPPAAQPPTPALGARSDGGTPSVLAGANVLVPQGGSSPPVSQAGNSLMPQAGSSPPVSQAGNSLMPQAGSSPPVSQAGSSLMPQAGANVLVPQDGVNLLVPQGGLDDEDDELAAYNRYLAYLAVKGKAKTWRNPRGDR